MSFLLFWTFAQHSLPPEGSPAPRLTVLPACVLSPGRVQKEQLAAIFKLMEDNKETFGEMSHGDVQEQLRLYDM